MVDRYTRVRGDYTFLSHKNLGKCNNRTLISLDFGLPHNAGTTSFLFEVEDEDLNAVETMLAAVDCRLAKGNHKLYLIYSSVEIDVNVNHNVTLYKVLKGVLDEI